MARRWMGMALVAAGLAVGAPARGQPPYLPSPVGAARMPEPLPCGPAASVPQPQPNLIPGPINPDVAPMGPPDCLSLSADSPNAFQCERFADDDHWYFSAGMQLLERQRLGAAEIAAQSPDVHPGLQVVQTTVNITANDISTVFAMPAFSGLSSAEKNAITRAVNTGSHVIDRLAANPNVPSLVPATVHSPVLQQLNQLVPGMDLGVRGTLGYMWDDNAIEYTSYYVFQDTRGIHKTDPGRVDGLFYNPPAGFGPVGPVIGDHGLWTDADHVLTTFGSTFWNNELNYRKTNLGIRGVELILGIRYVQEQDALSILTGDGNIPIANAFYNVNTQNNIVAPQFGGEWSTPITCWWSFGLSGKAALGANFLDTEVKLQRGDGLVGFDTLRAATSFAQIYDIGAFTDFHILDRLNLRIGYNAIWLLGIATAPDQIDFNLQGNQKAFITQFLGTHSTAPTLLQNLAQRYIQIQALHQMELNAVRNEPHGKVNNNGSALFQGPMFEFQFLF